MAIGVITSLLGIAPLSLQPNRRIGGDEAQANEVAAMNMLQNGPFNNDPHEDQYYPYSYHYDNAYENDPKSLKNERILNIVKLFKHKVLGNWW